MAVPTAPAARSRRRRANRLRRRPAGASPRRAVGGALTAAAVATRLGALAAGMLLAVAILFVVFHANPGNAIVSGVRDAAHWLVGPWHDMFTPHSAVGREVANRAVAAGVYVIGGLWLARLLRRAAGRVRR